MATFPSYEQIHIFQSCFSINYYFFHQSVHLVFAPWCVLSRQSGTRPLGLCLHSIALIIKDYPKSILLIPNTYCELRWGLQLYFQFVVWLALGSTLGMHQHRPSHLRCTPCAAHSCTIAPFPPFHPNNIGAASCLWIQSLRGKQSRGEGKGVERESDVNYWKVYICMIVTFHIWIHIFIPTMLIVLLEGTMLCTLHSIQLVWWLHFTHRG